MSRSVCYELNVFMLAANVIVFVCANLAGLFIHNSTDRTQRRTFKDTRDCIAARLDIQDQNEKLVSSIRDVCVASLGHFEKKNFHYIYRAWSNKLSHTLSTDDELKKWGTTWHKLQKTAQNRVRWRTVVDSLCSAMS
ncbi:adenylate cyclase [Elysia marginata]|uniref:Adenylate cyclase n=1 Tax=Elysia marginata TaxID=1093978 RepID=A0AAV4JCU8_9GAST|nr:adenylate cyclase [Elysia marginata]